MWQLAGQSRIISLLQRSLEMKTLAHAYLFVGPAHVGKMTLALDLARALNCGSAEAPCGECVSCRKIGSGGHADVQTITLSRNENLTEAKLIGIDQIKEMQRSAALPPFEGRHKIFIIDGAELLSIEAANCLLKTLEEPADRVTFVLLAVNDALLPATVVSRCQRLDLFPLPVNEVESVLSRRGMEPQKARLLARLSHGRPGWALSVEADSSILTERAEEMDRLVSLLSADIDERFVYAAQLAARFGQDRGAVYGTLDLWTDYWRDLMLARTGCAEMVTNIDRQDVIARMAGEYRLSEIKGFIQSIRRAEEQLGQNANPRLVLEVLMLDMPACEGGAHGNLASEFSEKHG